MPLKYLFAWLLIFAAAQIAFGQKTDLTVTDISRVAGKNELKVTIANKGAVKAKSGELKIYALPYGFCSSASDYNSLIETNPNNPCLEKPFEIPPPQRFSSIENSKNMLGLAWTTTEVKAFSVEAGANVELIVSFPQKIMLSSAAKSKRVYPVPFVSVGGLFVYAPTSLAAFDLSVFHAVVDSEAEADKTNNAYFFNIRRRPQK